MSAYDDNLKIRLRCQEISNLLGQDCLVEWGDSMPGQPGVILLVGSASITTKQSVTLKAKAIRTVLYNYPETVPVASVRVTWPVVIPPPGGVAPAATTPPPPPQIPPPPPWIWPESEIHPPTTPPGAQGKIYIARNPVT